MVRARESRLGKSGDLLSDDALLEAPFLAVTWAWSWRVLDFRVSGELRGLGF